MPKPLKVLYQTQFTKLDTKVPASGHVVTKVEFFDWNCDKKTGFFKPTDPSYPPLLAKYVVAISVAIRLALGDRAAEDRLVLNDKNEIIGTISINMPKYQPMNMVGQSQPQNPQQKEEVIPSAQTLLEYDIAELLVSAWRYKCDDRHPGNLSLYGLIDWDMCLYPYTYIIKGARLVDSISKKSPVIDMKLQLNELNEFPVIESRTHWPTMNVPGNYNVIKRYQAAAQFHALAGNASIVIGNKMVTFQEQMFRALLKELLSFDEDMLRSQLIDYLGDFPLNYLELQDNEKKEQLTQIHGELFTPESNAQAFVDHIMKIFNKEYDELYHLVVRYPGCNQNKKKVPVVNFNQFLLKKPSAFHHVLNWVEEQNNKMEESFTNYLIKANQAHNSNVIDAYAVKKEHRYDLMAIKKRYHKIWRDSFRDRILLILKEIQSLAGNLTTYLRKKYPEENQPLALPLEDKSSHTMHLPPELLGSSIFPSDSQSTPIQGLRILEDFYKELHVLIQTYFKIPANDLTIDHTETFQINLSKLVDKHQYDLNHAIEEPTYLQILGKQIQALDQLRNDLRFDLNLHKKDEPLPGEPSLSSNIYPLYTGKMVVQDFLKVMFDLANKLDGKSYHNPLNNLIENTFEHYRSSFSVWRTREKKITQYLKETDDDGRNRIGYIFSFGDTKNTSFNTFLMKEFISTVSKEAPLELSPYFPAIELEIERKNFDASFYAAEAKKFAQEDEKFTHLLSKRKITQFYNDVLKFLNQIPSQSFKKIIVQSLSQYNDSSSLINLSLFKTRAPEIKGYLAQNRTNKELLLLIFSSGDCQETSLNTILLNNLFSVLDKENLLDKKNNFQRVFKEDEHLVYYAKRIQALARKDNYLPEYTSLSSANSSSLADCKKYLQRLWR